MPTLAPHFARQARLATAPLCAVALLTLLPGAALAGAGGTEFQATYDMLIGWMTGLLGRIIAIAFIIVGLIAGVARQSIMSFAIGIAAGLGLFMAPDIIDAVVSATLPIT
jgi:conjugal transfer pilus assembly protein TraA